MAAMFHLLGLVLMAHQAGLPPNIHGALDRWRFHRVAVSPGCSAPEATHKRHTGCHATKNPKSNPGSSRPAHTISKQPLPLL